jgi:hypothetical protein
VGASPTRQPLQPEAIEAVMDVTKWLKHWRGSRDPQFHDRLKVVDLNQVRLLLEY